MPQYSIYIEPNTYIVKLNDSDGKIVYEKDNNSVAFRKRLDGKFSFSRSTQIECFDRLMALTFCENGVITVTENSGEIAQGIFMKKDLTISESLCEIEIKFDKKDQYSCLDKIADKEFNILATYFNYPELQAATASVYYDKQYQYLVCSGTTTVNNSFSTIYGWTNLNHAYEVPYFTTLCTDGDYWNFYENTYTLSGAYTAGGPNTFFVETKWFREIKLIAKSGGSTGTPPVPTMLPCDIHAWNFIDEITLHGIVFDRFARSAEIGSVNKVGTLFSLDEPFILRTTLADCAYLYKDFTRCRRLTDVINAMIYECFPNGMVSEFFQSAINPISGRDLRNILLAQKSDCIGTTSDPARKGIITFKNLMLYLYAEFQVLYAVDSDGNFRIEHKKYWDNNGSYTVANSVDIDLTVIYPQCLIGTNEYSFESSLPIRENFKFMESWSYDFIGRDIDYSDCITTGDTISYSASEITTEVDPTLLDSLASKEGFCMFHCDQDGFVIKETGALTDVEISNAHLSWANLHDSYWKYGRYLPSGKMNGETTDFDVRPLKYQKPVDFPYCFGEFNPNRLIRTNLGDGGLKKASYSFKTQWITVELEYIDNV
jgi:hypothetical protein